MVKTHFPPTAMTLSGPESPTLVHGRILPFLEKINLYEKVDLSVAWDDQDAIDGVKIEVYACPSDPGSDEPRYPGNGRPTLFPTSYGFNFGTWFVFNPMSKKGGDGMFYPNRFMRYRDCLDGSSHTLLVAEVKAWTHYMRNGGPPSPTKPADAKALVQVAASGVQFKETGHTEWPDGRVHHTGFTTLMTPNTKALLDRSGVEYDVDYNSWQEGKHGNAGNPTYAAITSRSYHVGLVHAGFLDGSVTSITDSIDIDLWHALGTRRGRERMQREP